MNGDVNTGLTLRTIRLKDGIAEVRAGATLLYDSVPEDEEKETELKASALIAAHPRGRNRPCRRRVGGGVRRSARARASFWSTTRIASSTRWPTISGRPAPR